jgi:hypothetical protein
MFTALDWFEYFFSFNFFTGVVNPNNNNKNDNLFYTQN